ncbi:hypothetical protein LOTGIDRAFT_91690, partial [Lottia gigantea]
PFDIARSGPALDMALEKVRYVYNDTINFKYIYKDGGSDCVPDIAGAIAADVFHNKNVSVFIGPGCSLAVEQIGYMAARWNLPIITPVGTSATLANKKAFPTLTRLAFGLQEFAVFYMKLLEIYQWKHIALIYDTDFSFTNIMGSSIYEEFRTTKLSMVYFQIQSSSITSEEYQRILVKANDNARVFLIFAMADDIRQFLLTAHDLGFTQGEHVFLATIPVYLKLEFWRRDDSYDQKAKEAYKSAMFITLAESFDVSYKLFKKQMINRSRIDYGFEYGREEPNVLLPRFYDSVLIYAQILNETLTEGGDPLNGLAMTERMKNRTFNGISGKVSINSNGDRFTDLVLYDMTKPDEGEFEVVGYYDGPTMLRWRLNAQKDLWWWKIEKHELEISRKIVNRSRLSHLSRVSENHIKFYDLNSFKHNFERSSLNSSIIHATEMNVDVAVYKGVTVQVKKLDVTEVPITKRLLKEFKEIRDITQSNIAKVIGACLESNNICIVLEYCPKGTLQDVIGNTEINLDANFRYSIAIDVAQGMTFIHQSSIHHHGNLSSMVCLIDNRFSVKITDVGLRYLYTPEHLRNDDVFGSREGDVYSFGIILQEILTRDSPFSLEASNLGAKDVIMKLKENKGEPFRPQVDFVPNLGDMGELMKRCWHEIPCQRPIFKTILKELKHMAGKLGASGSFLDNLLRRMELYANNLEHMVDEKTQEVKEEKKRSEELLYQIIPKSVAERLKRGLRVEPEAFDCITIYFSDICGFTTISARSKPMEVVVDLLNDLYSCFDAILEEFDVYKVETIGDAYMVASGLPQRNGHKHAEEIARMSLALLKAIDSFRMRHLPDEKLKLRIGLHSGPVCAGVVGIKMPRYCLFGDTVNTASRMESHGEGLRIHMSESTTEILQLDSCFEVEKRGDIEIKGKGLMTTYWL